MLTLLYGRFIWHLPYSLQDSLKKIFKRVNAELDKGVWRRTLYELMEGYEKSIDNTPVNYTKINKLKEELTNIDRRRGCDWKKTFPWLDEFNENKE